jgi:hypothetical protein
MKRGPDDETSDAEPLTISDRLTAIHQELGIPDERELWWR